MADEPMAPPPQPPAHQPEPREPMSWRRIAAWTLAIIVTAGGAGTMLIQQAKRFSASNAEVQAQKGSLLGQLDELRGRQVGLQGNLTALKEAHAALEADRDHLQQQAKRLMQEKDDLAVVTDLHERVLKRTAEENRALKGKLEPLQQEHAALLDQHRLLGEERDSLRQQLESAHLRSGERRLEEELAKQKTQHKKDIATLYDARKQVKELQARQSKLASDLPKLQAKFASLQEQYTKALAENKALKFKSKTVPAEVTNLAREHQRMVKDLADTHYNMGLMFVRNDDFARAVKEFVKVIELKPDDADAAYNLGLIYAEHLPDREKATEYFRRYLQLNPRAKDAAFVKQYIASWKAWEAEDSLE